MLAAPVAAKIARFARAALVEVTGQPYMRTAAAKGVAQRARLTRHALPNAAIPLVTFLGFELGLLIGRALESETDPAKRKALFAQMLDAWEDECPATLLYRPLEIYGVKKSVSWRPYTFYFMDLRPDNLSFAKPA